MLRLLHAGLHADAIGDHPLQPGIEIDDEVHRVDRLPRQLGQEGGEQRAGRRGDEIGGELGPQLGAVGEGKGLGLRLDEEVEGIDDREFGDNVDLDAEFVDRLRKDEARQPVARRVLLPVHEMLRRGHLERIALDRGAAMRGGAQTDDLRPERDRPVIGVVGDVVQRGDDSQCPALWSRGGSRRCCHVSGVTDARKASAWPRTRHPCGRAAQRMCTTPCAARSIAFRRLDSGKGLVADNRQWAAVARTNEQWGIRCVT
ncbi:hypothetical protein D3C87_1413800 [compost metagenome]